MRHLKAFDGFLSHFATAKPPEVTQLSILVWTCFRCSNSFQRWMFAGVVPGWSAVSVELR